MVAGCCQLNNLAQVDLSTLAFATTNTDNSYGVYLPFGEIADGETKTARVYYGAGAVADLAAVGLAVFAASNSPPPPPPVAVSSHFKWEYTFAITFSLCATAFMIIAVFYYCSKAKAVKIADASSHTNATH